MHKTHIDRAAPAPVARIHSFPATAAAGRRRTAVAARFSKDGAKSTAQAGAHGAPPPLTPISSSDSQQQLLKTLLQLHSVSSLDEEDLPARPLAGPASSAALRSTTAHAAPPDSRSEPRRNASASANLYDDASAADHDPMLLDLLGFTSVSSFLQHKLDVAGRQAKVSCAGALLWAGVAAVLLAPLGGPAAYPLLLRELGGSSSDTYTLIWLHLVGYFTAKGAVMSAATGWREWQERAKEPQELAAIEQLEPQLQRRAFWLLQERLARAEQRANRSYTEFAVASCVLGLLLAVSGGPGDHLELQLEALDQQALSRLLVMLLLFWEVYLNGIGAVVQLVVLGVAFVNKLSHAAKWEQGDKQE